MLRTLLSTLLVGALLGPAFAHPAPQVTLPGAQQPNAPGQRNAPKLPDLTWPGRPSQFRHVEYASNGHIEVAHALILVDKNQEDEASLLRWAQTAVEGAFSARPGLHEVDVSIYHAGTYMGFGGPPPLCTTSVRNSERNAFGPRFPRMWLAGQSDATTLTPHLTFEKKPVFHGSGSELQRHRDMQEGQTGVALHNGLFFHGNPVMKTAALTFDDSPHPLYAPLMLDTLKRANIKGTFFCIGRNARAYPYFIKDMAEQGHEIANHTYHHVRLPKLPATQVRAELDLCNDVLEGITNKPVRMFRPPGGEYSSETLHLAKRSGLTTAFWTDDPGDFDHPGEAVIEKRLLQHLRPGGIILLHDNVLETIQILPAFLKLAKREGYIIVTASELADEP